MELFYSTQVEGGLCTLTEEESRHCAKVLRHTAGDIINVIDGSGTLYECRIVECGRQVVCSVESAVEGFGAHGYHLTMAVCPTKNIDRYEWFLEKATEIGVSEIYPLESAHSERRQIKDEREQKVITAAVKQSLKAYHPKLHPMTSVREVMALDFDGEKYIAHCDSSFGEKEYLGKLIKKGGKNLILIGPEGDFSKEEINFAAQNGFKAVTLGRERLRTETAAVVATAIVSTINKL